MDQRQRGLAEEAVRRLRVRTQNQRRLEGISDSLVRSLHASQQEFFADKSKKRLGRCSRRAGKTHLAAVGLVDAAVRYPNTLVPYITLSIKNARRILWGTLRGIEQQYAMGMEFLENQLVVKVPNGSQIILGGCTDREEIEKFRGSAYSRCVVDESQSIKTSILEILIDDVIEAATLDLDGEIWMFGTPNASASGYFFDANLKRTSPWKSFSWTLLDNPHLPGARDWLKRRMEENGWDEDDPTYRREYCGDWCRDENSLVYAFSKKRNVSEDFPEGEWHYGLGIDLGFSDATALVVVAWSDTVPETYVLDVEKHHGLVTDDIAKRVRMLDAEYGFDRIVCDTGGLGVMITEELNRRHSLNIEAAQKRKKFDHIELMNSDLKKGKLLVVENERTKLLIDEIEILEWDHVERAKGKWIEKSDNENHACDALLYIWRESLGFLHRPGESVFEYGSEGWYRREEQQMEEAALAEIGDQEVEWDEESGMDPVFVN